MVHIWCLLGRKDWTKKKNNTHIHNSMLWIKISLVELLLLYVLLLYKCFRVFIGFFLLELLKNITKLFWIKNWYIWNEGKVRKRESEIEMKMSFGSFRWNHAGILCSIVMHSLQRLTFIWSLKSWRPCDLITQNNQGNMHFYAYTKKNGEKIKYHHRVKTDILAFQCIWMMFKRFR